MNFGKVRLLAKVLIDNFDQYFFLIMFFLITSLVRVVLLDYVT